MARRKRVLLAWERGLGFGHSTHLARIGRRLAGQDVEVVAAVPHRTLSAPLETAGIPLLDAPAWPAPSPRPDDHIPASATLTDGLAAMGLRDADCVRAVLRGWRALLDTVQPDLVVCNYAPLAGVAARGRARVMRSGTAYYTPPDHFEAMPFMVPAATPRHRDAETLAAVNAALDAEGLAPLPRIGALFASDDAFVATFPLLDFYADHRSRDAEGPLFDEMPLPQRRDARGIFGYLHPELVAQTRVLETLCGLGTKLALRSPGLPPDMAQRLTAAGVRLHRDAVRVAPTIAGARLVLHQGSAGMAADALAAGVPQMTLCVHIEHHLNGSALAAAGLGRHVGLPDPAARLDADLVRDAMADEDLAFVAAAAGRIHRQTLEDWPLDRLTARCRALL